MMRAECFFKFAALAFAFLASYSCHGFDTPDFIVRSAAPDNLKLEITGQTALITPEIEKQLVLTPVTQFTDRVIGPCTAPMLLQDSSTQQQTSKFPAEIDRTVLKSRGSWMRFKLQTDGEKRRYSLYTMEGVLLRDQAFDGNLSVHFLVDSGQANIFRGASRISIPFLSDFYPVSRSIRNTSNWEVEKGFASAKVDNAFDCKATMDQSGFVERLTITNGDRVQEKIAIGWRKIAFFSIPSVVAEVKGDSKNTRSILFTAIESCNPIAGISENEIKVCASKGTTIVQDGRTQKLREDTGDLRDYAR